MPRPLSAAHLTAIDLAPPRFIEAAAKAGFDGVGLRLLRVTDTSPGYPLSDDPAMLRATKMAMAATGITVGDIEFLKVTPDTRVADYEWLFDMGAELGAHHLITAPYDPDLSRLSDTLSALAEAGKSRGVAIIHEFFPWTSTLRCGWWRRPDLRCISWSIVCILIARGPRLPSLLRFRPIVFPLRICVTRLWLSTIQPMSCCSPRAKRGLRRARARLIYALLWRLCLTICHCRLRCR